MFIALSMGAAFCPVAVASYRARDEILGVMDFSGFSLNLASASFRAFPCATLRSVNRNPTIKPSYAGSR